MSPPALDPRALDYAAFYCEENVWRLLARAEFSESSEAREDNLRNRGLRGPAHESSFAVFVTGEGGHVPVYAQRRAPPGRPVFWDYHVFAVADGFVYDLDSTAPFPCPLDEYLARAFPPPKARAVSPRFVVFGREDYLTRFWSDRAHMRRPDGWSAPPPPWPTLTPDTPSPLRLAAILAGEAGERLDLAELARALRAR